MKEGGIAALIQLSTIQDVIIQRSCAIAFANLTLDKSIRPRMLEENAVVAILGLIANSRRTVHLDCVVAICNLCTEIGYEFKAAKDGAAYVVSNLAKQVIITHKLLLEIM